MKPHCDALAPRTYADLIGKAFTPGARGPLSFDCYGLVREVLRRNGISAPDYPSNGDANLNAATILAAMESWEEVSSPEANCVVLFRMDRRQGTHVGVMVDGQRFLHALKETGVCVERINSPLWHRRVIGFYKWGLADGYCSPHHHSQSV